MTQALFRRCAALSLWPSTVCPNRTNPAVVGRRTSVDGRATEDAPLRPRCRRNGGRRRSALGHADRPLKEPPVRQLAAFAALLVIALLVGVTAVSGHRFTAREA